MIDRREFMEKLNMTINGKAISVDVDPGIRLVDFLRDNLFLTGTKIGCGKGECGCMHGHYERKSSHQLHYPCDARPRRSD